MYRTAAHRHLLVAVALLGALLTLPAPVQAQSRGFEVDPVCPVPSFSNAAMGYAAIQEKDGPAQFPSPEPLHMLFLPIDFENLPVEEAPEDVVGDLADRLQADLETLSEGHATLTYDIAPQVYRMPEPLHDPYATEAERVLPDALAVADDDIDFAAYDVIHVIFPQQDNDLTEAVSYADLGTPLPVPVDGVSEVWAVRYGPNGFDRYTALHEVLHLFGAPDVYASDVELDPDGARFAGGWSIMRGPEYDHLPNASTLNFGWDQLRIGWMDLADTECVREEGTVEVTLRPLADPTGAGVRLVRIPLSDGDHLLLELRVEGPLDSQICDGRSGVLAYRHDTAFESSEGIYQVIDATPGSIPPYDPDAGEEDRGECLTDVDDGTLQAGDGPLDLGDGVTVEVLQQDDGSAVVEVTRPDTFGSRLLSADGLRQVASYPFGDDPATTPRTAEFDDPVNQAWDVSQIRFTDDSARHVVITRDDAFADALAGTPLLGEGPMLLLYGTTELVDFVREELDRVLPEGGRVYLLGGTAAVDPLVEQQLRDAGYDVSRLSGGSRVETSAAIAAEVMRLYPETATQVLVARAFGEGTAAWADAVAVGGYAARYRTPLVVTATSALSAGLDEVLSGVGTATLLGGEAALAAQVAADLTARGLEVDRVSGPSRDATAAAIGAELWPSAGAADRYVLISGAHERGWATGLPAAGLSADFDAPALLLESGRIPTATAALLTTCTPGSLETLVHAGAGQVPDDILAQVESLDGAC